MIFCTKLIGVSNGCSSRPRRAALTPILLAAFISVLAPFGSYASISPAEDHVASQEERDIGNAWPRAFRGGASLWEDSLAMHYLEDMVSSLAHHAGLSIGDLTLLLADDDSLNAFAVPGGVVGVNAGLFRYAPSEGAFASVIAHELAHLSQRHYARGKDRHDDMRIATLAGMALGVAASASGAGQAGAAIAMGAQAASLEDQLRYSRRYEREADFEGIKILESAGYSGAAMVEMFEEMQRLTSLRGGTPPAFLLSHPLSEERLSAAQDRQDDGLSNPGRMSAEFGFVRARALHKAYVRQPQRGLAQLESDAADPAVIAYYSALVDAQAGRRDKSVESLLSLADESGSAKTLLWVTAAEVSLSGRDYIEAQRLSESALREDSDYFPALVTLIQAQLGLGLNQAAFENGQQLTSAVDDHPEFFRLMARAAGASGNHGWGFWGRAEALQLEGDLEGAREQLRFAEQSSGHTLDSELQNAISEKLALYDRVEEIKSRLDL